MYIFFLSPKQAQRSSEYFSQNSLASCIIAAIFVNIGIFLVNMFLRYELEFCVVFLF